LRRALLHRDRTDPGRRSRAAQQAARRRPVRVLYRIGSGFLMRATLKILAWILGGLFVVCVVLVGFIVLAANQDWGRRLIEATTAQFSGGNVVVAGISGHLPDDLRVAHAEVRDGQGAWIVADDLALQWSLARLRDKHLQIALARAGRVQLLRLPSPSERGAESSPLQGRIDVDRIEVNQ